MPTFCPTSDFGVAAVRLLSDADGFVDRRSHASICDHVRGRGDRESPRAMRGSAGRMSVPDDDTDIGARLARSHSLVLSAPVGPGVPGFADVQDLPVCSTHIAPMEKKKFGGGGGRGGAPARAVPGQSVTCANFADAPTRTAPAARRPAETRGLPSARCATSGTRAAAPRRQRASAASGCAGGRSWRRLWAWPMW
jgi:hypothetical protein